MAKVQHVNPVDPMTPVVPAAQVVSDVPAAVPASTPTNPANTPRWRVEIPMCLCAPAVVEAANEADALAAYMAANGILGTSQLPAIKRVAAESPATE